MIKAMAYLKGFKFAVLRKLRSCDYHRVERPIERRPLDKPLMHLQLKAMLVGLLLV
jgi:hypothetical protein